MRLQLFAYTPHRLRWRYYLQVPDKQNTLMHKDTHARARAHTHTHTCAHAHAHTAQDRPRVKIIQKPKEKQ